MENIPTLESIDTSPFKRLVLSFGAVPTDFKESMTYYELLAWLCNVIEKQIIPTVNQHSEKFNELITAFNTLKQWCEDYFENLDVQEEINNKLDDMTESGQLQTIIEAYIQLNAVIVFNTEADMIASLNLADGMTVRTLGKTTYNDGLGATYRIREITNDDVVDGIKIIELDVNNELIAEFIPSNAYEFNSVADMKDATFLPVGAFVKTAGYNSAGDGGDAKYVITATNTTYSEALDNGLYAHLINPSNILQLGAKGDFSTDTSTIIETAISIMDDIYIPAGRYKISDTINVGSENKKIHGVSFKETSILERDANFEGSLISSVGASNLIFEDLCFKVTNISSTSDFVVSVLDGNSNTFNRCYFKGPSGNSTRLLHIAKIDENAVVFLNKITKCRFENGRISMTSSTDSYILDNEIWNPSDTNNPTLYLTNCANSEISGNQVVPSQVAGIYVTASDANSLKLNTGLRITNNYIDGGAISYSNTGDGIRINGMSHSVVSDNVFWHCKGRGIRLNGTVAYCTFTNLQFNNCGYDNSGVPDVYSEGGSLYACIFSNNLHHHQWAIINGAEATRTASSKAYDLKINNSGGFETCIMNNIMLMFSSLFTQSTYSGSAWHKSDVYPSAQFA